MSPCIQTFDWYFTFQFTLAQLDFICITVLKQLLRTPDVDLDCMSQRKSNKTQKGKLSGDAE